MRSKIHTITQTEEKKYQTVSEYLDYLDTLVDTDYDDQDYHAFDNVQRDLDDTFSENQLEDRSEEIQQHNKKVTELQQDNIVVVSENNKDKTEITNKLSKADESAQNISSIEKTTQTKMQYITSKFNYYFSIAKSYAMFDVPPEMFTTLMKVSGALVAAAGIYFAKKDLFNTLISQGVKFFAKKASKPVVEAVVEPKMFPKLIILAKEVSRALGKFFSSF